MSDALKTSYNAQPATFAGFIEVIKALGKHRLKIVDLTGEGNGGAP